jgi:hypothetical protein
MTNSLNPTTPRGCPALCTYPGCPAKTDNRLLWSYLADWPGGLPPAKPTPATKPAAKPAANLRYEGSAAQKWDVALEKGGDIGVLAKQAGVTKGALRAHAKYREKSGKWKLTENGDNIKMMKVAAAA